MSITQTAQQKWVMGNWKLNPNSLEDALSIVNALVEKVKPSNSVNIAIAPSLLHLQAIQPLLPKSIALMAQDVGVQQTFGAFTGDINAQLLNDINVSHCLVGHSERRQYHQETQTQLVQKISNCIDNGIQAVYCVGEPLSVRDKAEHLSFVTEQLQSVLTPLSKKLNAENLIVAYEPVWAIGTGKVASKENITEMHAHIRQTLLYVGTHLEKISLLYGGSVKPENAEEIAQCLHVDGALVGGASLNPEHFLDIVTAFG